MPQLSHQTMRCLIRHTVLCKHPLRRFARLLKRGWFPMHLLNNYWQGNDIYFPLPLPEWCSISIWLFPREQVKPCLFLLEQLQETVYRVWLSWLPKELILVCWGGIIQVMCHFLLKECAGEFLKLLLFIIKYFPGWQCWYKWKKVDHLFYLPNHIRIILAVVRLGSGGFDSQQCSTSMQVSSWIQLVFNFYSNYIF